MFPLTSEHFKQTNKKTKKYERQREVKILNELKLK